MPQDTIKSINPATEEVISEFQLYTDEELEDKVKLAQKAFESFSKTSFKQRAEWMNNAAKLLEQNKDKYGTTLTSEMGRPWKESILEPEKCAKWCKYFAEHAADFLRDTPVKTDAGKKSFITYEPMGILLQIAPFNYPFLQVFRFASAALMAGNVVLLRHSHNVSISALNIQELFLDAGFPQGIVQVLFITKEQVSKLIADPRIKGVTITGSVAAGKAVAKQCGEHLKKHVMELGGSDAYIICNDANLEEAVKECVKGRIVNNGQSCTAAKRFIVEEGVYQQFCDKYAQAMKALKMGDPMDETNDLGPMARKDLRDQVQEQVDKAIKDGAKLLVGGEIPKNRTGFFYPPTALADVTPENTAFKEEIFGPVAAIMKAKDVDDAINLCNMSMFGLGGGVFTSDITKGEKIARQMEVGMAFVNRIVTSNPQYPFGGVKDSGYGKECGAHGMKEWVRIKSVVMK